MIVGIGHLCFRITDHFAMIAQEYEKGVLKPRLSGSLFHEAAQAIIGIFNDLILFFTASRFKPFGYYIRRMVGYCQQCCKKRASGSGLPVDFRECVFKKVVVGNAEAIDDLIFRVVFLRMNIGVSVRAQMRSYCHTALRGS